MIGIRVVRFDTSISLLTGANAGKKLVDDYHFIIQKDFHDVTTYYAGNAWVGEYLKATRYVNAENAGCFLQDSILPKEKFGRFFVSSSGHGFHVRRDELYHRVHPDFPAGAWVEEFVCATAFQTLEEAFAVIDNLLAE